MMVRMTTEPGAETVPRDQDVHGALAAARAETERLTAVVQDLDDTTDLQSVDVDVTTTTVTLRLVEVSRPGKGPAARDYTAISEVGVTGRRAG